LAKFAQPAHVGPNAWRRKQAILENSVQKNDDRRPRVDDVARLAEVSVATVSRVLSGRHRARFSRETEQRVLEAARMLNYQPSELGRSLRTAQARAAALLVPDTTNGFCADVASSLEPILHANGMSMLLCNTAEDPARQDEYLIQIVSRGISAIVLLGAIASPELLRLSLSSTQLVFVNRRPPASIAGDFVGIDNFQAGRDVAAYFISKGYHDCAAIHGPLHYAASAERLGGFCARMNEEGIEVPGARRIEISLTPEAGYSAACRLLLSSRKPRAIFCGNDSIAYGVSAAATECGLRVPEDIAICGFDDNRLNRWLAPWLTTVHVPAIDFGPAIVDILRATANAGERTPTSVIFPHRLVVRQSA
jgi:LacI family transcriptional regulator